MQPGGFGLQPNIEKHAFRLNTWIDVSATLTTILRATEEVKEDVKFKCNVYSINRPSECQRYKL